MHGAYSPAYDRSLSDTWYYEDMNSPGYWLSLLFMSRSRFADS